MKSLSAIIILMTLTLLSMGGQALQTFSGETISIDVPVADDIIVAGSMVNINAPVDSAIVAGGNANINAPVKGDLIVAGGQVYVNSDVGGKVVAAGGNINLGGDIGTNLVAMGGQVNILPGRVIARDALIAGGNVVNAGKVNDTLTVSANQFNNTGSAGKVNYYKVEDRRDDQYDDLGKFNIFGLLAILGYLILGLVLVRSMPGIFMAVDREARSSTILKTLTGFVLIIASLIAIFLLALTVVGIPLALVSSFIIAAALMLTGTFLAFCLGKLIAERLKLNYGVTALFLIGFLVLNALFMLPYVGGLISLVSMSLGFAAIIYAARRLNGACDTKAA